MPLDWDNSPFLVSGLEQGGSGCRGVCSAQQPGLSLSSQGQSVEASSCSDFIDMSSLVRSGYDKQNPLGSCNASGPESGKSLFSLWLLSPESLQEPEGEVPGNTCKQQLWGTPWCSQDGQKSSWALAEPPRGQQARTSGTGRKSRDVTEGPWCRHVAV